MSKNLSYTYESRTFLGKVILDQKTGRNRLKMMHDSLFTHELSKIKSGTDVAINLEIRKPKRTEQQNRYYWLYLEILARETGYTEDELHEAFKKKFLGKGRKMVCGEDITLCKSTTTLSVSGFIDYILSIENETGIIAPDTKEFMLASLR